MVTTISIPCPVAAWAGRTGSIVVNTVDSEDKHRVTVSLAHSEIFTGTLDELAQLVAVAEVARKLQIVLQDE